MPDKPLWQREFGLSYAVPPELEQHPKLVDNSWGNDISPSFILKREEAANQEREVIRIWVNHPVLEMREDPNQARFGIYDHHTQKSILETDELAKILAWVEANG